MAGHAKKFTSVFKRTKRRVERMLGRMDARRAGLVILAIFVVFGSVAGFLIERNRITVNYAELLNTIAQGESRGNYNAYFGRTNNQEVNFTQMTTAQVLEWQRKFVEDGSPSSAVGRYQFVRPTLAGLIKEMDIEPDAVFDSALQDRLAIRLVERRGVQSYMRGEISREQFAHNLSKEWAALPRVLGDNPNASYYAGDGLNHVRISIDQVFAAIAHLHDPASN